MADLSNHSSSSIDESYSGEDFVAFKTQVNKFKDLVEEYHTKIADQTLCADDLVNMETELKTMTELERRVTAEKMKPNYVPYKTLSLKLIQKSFRICNWLMEKQCKEIDNVFDIDSYFNLIFDACADKEDPLDHINTLFKNAMKNTNYFDLNFFGNIRNDESLELTVSTQSKKEMKRSQKRPLEELVVPLQVDNESVDNELQMTMKRITGCLKRALSNNGGKPVSFYKFAIDPSSFTYSVENLFNLASLVKDQIIKIEKDNENDEFKTITIMKKKKNTMTTEKDNVASSLLTLNHDMWEYYISKYNITEAMIEQDM